MDYEQLAEAHQRIADAHANLAGLLQGRCVQPTFLIPEVAPPAPQQPEKLRAPEGALFTSCPDWRQFIIQLERQLCEHFGYDPFHLQQLRGFLQEHVDLLPGDWDRNNSGRNGSPRWYQQLQKAVDCEAHCWPMGKPVIVSIKENRGYYRLA